VVVGAVAPADVLSPVDGKLDPLLGTAGLTVVGASAPAELVELPDEPPVLVSPTAGAVGLASAPVEADAPAEPIGAVAEALAVAPVDAPDHQSCEARLLGEAFM
jgi:hypothetical protein